MKHYRIIPLCVIIAIFVIGCSTKQTQQADSNEAPLEKITLNVCQTDPGIADYWLTTKVILFSRAGGLSAGAKKVGELPSCSSVTLEVLQKETVDGVEFYKVRYNTVVGWQTKRLLIGEYKNS